MVEVEEIELDLGLSIGGCFREKPKPGSRPDGFHSDTDSRMHQPSGVDSQEKREIQALRRMEAKKKREQKKERVSEPEPEFQRVTKRERTECVNGTVAWTTPFQQMQHYTAVQYMPLNNGFTLPCWIASEKNVNGIDGVNGGDRNGSSRCSSSVVSDYQTSSREDGGSTDSISHSSHYLAEPTHLNTSKSEETASSNSTKSKLSNNSQERNHIVKDNNTLSKDHNSSSRVIEMGNSHEKPLSQNLSSSLPKMPYVSTKGNGPNGKTVYGFLYRYSSKSEVSIVCVCHGSTFSPAEFVQHAGSTDISHPLKHITVIPFAFA